MLKRVVKFIDVYDTRGLCSSGGPVNYSEQTDFDRNHIRFNEESQR